MGLEWRCYFTCFLCGLKAPDFFPLLVFCSMIFLPCFIHGFVNALWSHLQLLFFSSPIEYLLSHFVNYKCWLFSSTSLLQVIRCWREVRKVDKVIHIKAAGYLFFFLPLFSYFNFQFCLCLFQVLKSVICFHNNFASSLLQSSSIPYHSGIPCSSSGSCSCCCHCHPHSTSTPTWSISPYAGFAI